ncbi:unnamed protein product [Haemonchus placei]|uniref:ANK_REP_REGION domain-containing protein n=1 Tax=Haemonchus placei TaxID=6290 RepID=A0A158QNX4_HAEPC|nr:unnamed protein product [Haemonchus placei]
MEQPISKLQHLFMREYLSRSCRRHLKISGSNKGHQSRFQIQSSVDCVAAHFCLIESSETTESATLLRSLAGQLTKRFPNLVLPKLSTLTLLADYDNALEQYFTLPLASLPRPTKPLFILIDNILPHIYDLVLAVSRYCYLWLLPDIHPHYFIIYKNIVIWINTTQFKSSWFFVDQMARAVDAGIVPPDRVSCSVKDLMDDICLALPQRLPIYLLLIKVRFIEHDQLFSARQTHFENTWLFIRYQFSNPLMVCGPWAEIDGDLALYHTAWAEFYKTKRRKTPQDVVELAYHLAHSTVPPLDAIRTLSSVGAGDLILKCAVIDIPTSVLLSKAGALQQEISLIVSFLDFVGGSISCTTLWPCLFSWRFPNPQIRNISNHVCNGQWNALRSAACNNHLDVLNLLIGLERSSRAGHRDIVSRLLKAHACVDRKDSEDRTALMAAAFMDHWEIVDLLLDHGAKISETDSAGATALHLALSNGSKTEAHDKTVQTLIRRGSDLTLADAHGRVCIHLAAYHGDRNLKALIGATCTDVQVSDSLGRTPLMLAASQGQLEAVDLLTKSGAYIDCIDSDGRTAFQLAAIHGHLPVVDMLLGLGADEAHKDNDGAVALHYAVAHGDVTLCRALATKATVRATDRAGNSPLMNACQGDNEEVSNQVFAKPQNPLPRKSTINFSGSRRLLAEHITDWEQQDMDGTPLVHTLLINKQVCAINDMCGARMLRRLAASFEAVDAGGRTPLLTAVWNCHLEMTAYLLETVGVNPNAVDEQGASALSVAAQQGNRELVVLLLRMGAEPSLKDLAGRTALDVATMYGHDTIRAVLQSASGSADSSGFGSVPNSPLDFRSLGRKSLRKSQKMAVTSPRLLKKPV